MTILLEAYRRPTQPAITTDVSIRCDRGSWCRDEHHPWHTAHIEMIAVNVADIRYRVTATLSGRPIRAPWNFTDRHLACVQFQELVAMFRKSSAAAETLAGAR